MTLIRKLTPEMLDGLNENDPLAIKSRHDLRRIHRFMGTQNIIFKALHQLDLNLPSSKSPSINSPLSKSPLKVLEIGAGDGSLLLGLACQLSLSKKLAPYWSHVDLTLIDQQDLVSYQTISDYAQFGWNVCVQKTDVMHWALNTIKNTDNYDLIIANLFLHHFSNDQLITIFERIKQQTDCFFACEPRRHWFALAASHLVGLIGANRVTRMDAFISVHAGFRDSELSNLWSAEKYSNRQSIDDLWRINEYSAGLFSHCFLVNKLAVSGAPLNI